jgi:hypothetical protein
MQSNIAKMFLGATILIGSIDSAATRADAGLVPDFWNAVFGPAGTPYFGGYSYYGGYRTYSTGYRSVCSPCNVPVCSPCATGTPCQVSKATGKLTPIEEKGELPKTFRGNGAKENGEKKSGKTEKPAKSEKDSPFKSRDETKKFEPTREESKSKTPPAKKEEKKEEGGALPKFGEGNQKTFKVPTKEIPETLIKQKKPAPAKPAKGEPKVKTNLQDGPAVLPLKLDEKLTWRSAAKRTRLVIHSRVASPTIVRTKLDANRNWTPVSRHPQVVKK